MNKIAIIVTILCVPMLVAGCVFKQSSTKMATENVIYRSMGNGLIGDLIKEIPAGERNRALQAEYKALEYTDSGNAINWSTSDDIASGIVTPGQPYRVGSQDCRQYSHSFIIRGIPQTNRGSACRNPNGSWSPLT